MNVDAAGSSGLVHARPSTSRIYNYLLGGENWFGVDAEAARAIVRSAPDAPDVARENLRFAGRAAGWAVAEHGLRQVLDIGVGIVTGIPIPSVEECVKAADPDAVVVAYDHDEMVRQHAKVLRPGYGGVLSGDVTDLDTIFCNPDAAGLLDMFEPAAVVLAAVLHFVPSPAAVMAGLRRRLAPGSVVILSHATSSRADGGRVAAMTRAYQGATGQIRFRTYEEILALADGWDIVTPPGLVDVQRWSVDGSRDGAVSETVRVLGMAAVLPGKRRLLARTRGGAS
ncbi:SAM-dependent methyltransferase [Actinomadura bangladeshensis]|uniref:SAM-dependent methyltransferase n=1 Tax=Actinomadura bangladeshensis TaxID=453573 RepID=UPI0014052FE8|nr:SAM-dependent methyltransferase [Actinomadura bangladeshensis]